MQGPKLSSEKTRKRKHSPTSITNDQSDHSANEADVEEMEPSQFNLGWADSVSKILKTNKPKKKKTLVLSKAKKLTDVKIKPVQEDVGFEIDGEIKEEAVKEEGDDASEKKDEEVKVKKKRKVLPSFRVKPNVLELDRERKLRKIGTRGVVQLFNAVRAQQTDIEQKIKEAGPLESRREKVLKSIDKRSFLDVLMQGKSINVDEEVETKDEDPKSEDQLKDETMESDEEQVNIPCEGDQSTWKVLRDDFMLGNKLKDWDKEVSDSEDDMNKANESDSD